MHVYQCVTDRAASSVFDLPYSVIELLEALKVSGSVNAHLINSIEVNRV